MGDWDRDDQFYKEEYVSVMRLLDDKGVPRSKFGDLSLWGRISLYKGGDSILQTHPDDFDLTTLVGKEVIGDSISVNPAIIGKVYPEGGLYVSGQGVRGWGEVKLKDE
tara:strand:- start:58631 stop:58954 length:324 start_codon:yes stop_codon:yes gene_type:complete